MRIVHVAAAACLILINPAVRAQSAEPAEIDERISKLVAAISENRMEQALRTLVGFGTRNTLSDTASATRGIGAARQWIFEQLQRSGPRLQVAFDTHQIPKGGRITRDVELRNVVAVLPGRSPRRIYVSGHYDTVNARVNAAAMTVLALAPPPPAVANDRGQPTIDRQPSGYDAHLRWTASPGAAGYRIFWREAWAPAWEHELYVGNVTEYVLPHLNIDDWVFGVAAVDAGGHESTVNAYVPAPAQY